MAGHLNIVALRNEKWYDKIVTRAKFMAHNIISQYEKNDDVIRLDSKPNITLLTDEYKCRPDIDRVFSFTTKSNDKIFGDEDIDGQTIDRAIFEVHLKENQVMEIFLVM
jgi:hypothetical protein